jgi:nitrite reductase/ring-hydroxylating ferredoxin subunit
MFVHKEQLEYARRAEDYSSPEAHRAEVEGHFLRAWHPVCLVGDLPRVGDFLTTELIGRPLLIRHTPDGLRAYLNICSHRHCLLTEAARGHAPGIACQYHGWEYGVDGRVSKVPDGGCFKPFDRENARLDTVAVATCGELVFVRLAAEGPSLASAIDALRDERRRTKYVLACTAGALRPLAAAGIAPDAAVLGVDEPDLEAILGQLPGGLLAGTTLVAPAVLESAVRRWWDGHLRLSGEGGGESEQYGSLGAGRAEERAHRLLRHVGCDPVALVGVDPLGLDGVWHARGTALDSAWSAQLNPFLTLATLEWRLGMQRREFHDAAMRRVRAFVSADREAGLRVIDSGAGAVPEALEMPLAEVLVRHAVVRRPLPLPPGRARARSVALPSVAEPVRRESRPLTAIVVAEADRGGTGGPP